MKKLSLFLIGLTFSFIFCNNAFCTMTAYDMTLYDCSIGNLI